MRAREAIARYLRENEPIDTWMQPETVCVTSGVFSPIPTFLTQITTKPRQTHYTDVTRNDLQDTHKKRIWNDGDRAGDAKGVIILY